jgi:hypothetical protein
MVIGTTNFTAFVGVRDIFVYTPTANLISKQHSQDVKKCLYCTVENQLLN